MALSTILKKCLMFPMYRRTLATVTSKQNELRKIKVLDPKDRTNLTTSEIIPVNLIYRTQQSNPELHTIANEGQFYTVPMEDYNKLFSLKLTLLTDFKDNVETFRECAFMVRKPALELFSYLNEINPNRPVTRYVFYGRDGTGKSISLLHAVHYAYKQGYVLFHVGATASYNIGKTMEEKLPSKIDGFWDQPRQGKIFLERFKLQNLELVEKLQLKTSQRYEWSPREATEANSPLMDIVNHGIVRVRHSCDCVEALAAELKQHADAGRCKVFVAADGINSFFYKTRHLTDEKELIDASQLSMVRAVSQLLKYDWKNGAVVVTVDERAAPLDHRESYLPRYLLTDAGFRLFDPFVPIRTENYSDKEVYSQLEYYIDRRWLQHELSSSPQGKLELVHLSGRNPRDLMRFATFW